MRPIGSAFRTAEPLLHEMLERKSIGEQFNFPTSSVDGCGMMNTSDR